MLSGFFGRATTSTNFSQAFDSNDCGGAEIDETHLEWNRFQQDTKTIRTFQDDQTLIFFNKSIIVVGRNSMKNAPIGIDLNEKRKRYEFFKMIKLWIVCLRNPHDLNNILPIDSYVYIYKHIYFLLS